MNSGARFPADCVFSIILKPPVVFNSVDVDGDESDKTVQALPSECLLPMGGIVTSGSAVCEVVATGNRTLLGGLVGKKQWPLK